MTTLKKVFLVVVGVLATVGLVVVQAIPNHVQPDKRLTLAVFSSDPVIKTIASHEVMYLAPQTKPPKGILFVAHGCHHSAGDFFKPSESCKHCLGLPEEQRILRSTLHRGYVLLAVSSADRDVSRCWNTHRPEIDLHPVAEIIKEVTIAEGWNDLPVYALGASSGGALVLMLPSVMKLSGICPQIMAMHPRHLSSVIEGLEGWPYPPTIFHHMSRDKRTATAVEGDLKVLQQKGIDAKEVAVESIPLTPSFLSDRIDGFPSDLSARIVADLIKDGWLAENGSFLQDPRASFTRWSQVVKGALEGANQAMSLQADQSPIFEELNLAYAAHEIISDHVASMFDWFESRKTASQ